MILDTAFRYFCALISLFETLKLELLRELTDIVKDAVPVRKGVFSICNSCFYCTIVVIVIVIINIIIIRFMPFA